jgi:hypothetical protein
MPLRRALALNKCGAGQRVLALPPALLRLSEGQRGFACPSCDTLERPFTLFTDFRCGCDLASLAETSPKYPDYIFADHLHSHP